MNSKAVEVQRLAILGPHLLKARHEPRLHGRGQRRETARSNERIAAQERPIQELQGIARAGRGLGLRVDEDIRVTEIGQFIGPSWSSSDAVSSPFLLRSDSCTADLMLSSDASANWPARLRTRTAASLLVITRSYDT